MSDYRIYGLDLSGRITFGDHFECRDDDHALETARGLLGRFASIEVWSRARRVGVVSRDTHEAMGARRPDGGRREHHT